MKEWISNETKSQLKILGLYQIIGGAIGLFLISNWFSNNPKLIFHGSIITMFFLLFFLYSIVCGILCWLVSNKALGFSFINQLLQLVSFAVFGIAYSYIAGIYLTAGIDLSSSFEFRFGAGISRTYFFLNNPVSNVGIEFNFIAFGLIAWILRLKKRIKTETSQASKFTN